MKDEPNPAHDDNVPSQTDVNSLPSENTDGHVVDPVAECRRLREQVGRLQQECDSLRQKLEQAEAERRSLHQSIADTLRKNYTEEQLRHWANDDDLAGCLTLAEFIHELEGTGRGTRDA